MHSLFQYLHDSFFKTAGLMLIIILINIQCWLTVKLFYKTLPKTDIHVKMPHFRLNRFGLLGEFGVSSSEDAKDPVVDEGSGKNEEAKSDDVDL
ncbi:unnamed protein product [Diamesa serratosioi]